MERRAVAETCSDFWRVDILCNNCIRNVVSSVVRRRDLCDLAELFFLPPLFRSFSFLLIEPVAQDDIFLAVFLGIAKRNDTVRSL